MPNWCNNYIIISGEPENMKPLYDYFTESERIAQEVNKVRRDIIASGTSTRDEVLQDYPYPDNPIMRSLYPLDEEYEAIVAAGARLTPYSDFFGTKWDFDFIDANVNDISEDCITLSPLTAWSPCDSFCQKISKKYGVEVQIEYDEMGEAFVGREVYNNGEQIEFVFYANTEETPCGYLEGFYHLDRDQFWATLESEMETYLEDLDEPEEGSAVDFIELYAPFINEEHVMQVEKLYNELKTEVDE
jgi:hypothetical protein